MPFPEGWDRMAFDDFLAALRKRMAMVVRDAMARLADPGYELRYADPSQSSSPEPSSDNELRALVDADILPSGTTIAIGEGPEQVTAQVLPDGRLYADGETYDGLIELSEALALDGNPWSLWSANLTDGRVSLGTLREQI